MKPFAPLILVALACGATSLASAQTLAKHGLALKGGQGQSVMLAPTADDKGALLQIKGVNNPIDGVVFLTDKVVEGDRVAYRTQIDGRSWNLLRTEEQRGWLRATAYLPGVRDGVALSYDERSAKALDLAALSSEYQRQKKAGVQEKLARFDRPAAEAAQQKALASTDATASQACGTPVKTTVNWSGLSDDQLQRLSISGFCGTVANAMRSLCSSDAAFKPQAVKSGQVQCQFGDKLNLRRDGNQLVFTTQEKAPNQDDFALQFLRNQ